MYIVGCPFLIIFVPFWVYIFLKKVLSKIFMVNHPGQFIYVHKSLVNNRHLNHGNFLQICVKGAEIIMIQNSSQYRVEMNILEMMEVSFLFLQIHWQIRYSDDGRRTRFKVLLSLLWDFYCDKNIFIHIIVLMFGLMFSNMSIFLLGSKSIVVAIVGLSLALVDMR